MLAGKRNRRVVVERATITQDAGSGENIETWTTLATEFAEVLPLSDRELVQVAEVSAEITTRFRLAWKPTLASVNPKDRLSFNGQTWGIWGVKEIGFREGIEISASARSD